MIVKLELEKLCKEFIYFLHDAKKQSLISEDELELHLKRKLEFLKEDEENLRA